MLSKELFSLESKWPVTVVLSSCYTSLKFLYDFITKKSCGPYASLNLAYVELSYVVVED